MLTVFNISMSFICRNIRINQTLCECGLVIQSIKITVSTIGKLVILLCESSELNADSWFL